MARYRKPLDPRHGKSELLAGGREPREPVPWRWLGMGAIVTVVGILLAITLANRLLARTPLPVTPLAPTVIVLTAPPGATPTATPMQPTPSPIPTVTLAPTPNAAVPPEAVTPGFYARVTNTGGLGVTIRGGPSTNNVPITVAAEDTVLFILDGPEEGNDLLWWQVRLEDGTEGWAAADYLVPAPAP